LFNKQTVCRQIQCSTQCEVLWCTTSGKACVLVT